MAKPVSVIGVDPTELGWIRLLVFLFRHPDPMVPELMRQALLHVERVANRTACESGSMDHAG